MEKWWQWYCWWNRMRCRASSVVRRSTIMEMGGGRSHLCFMKNQHSEAQHTQGDCGIHPGLSFTCRFQKWRNCAVLGTPCYKDCRQRKPKHTCIHGWLETPLEGFSRCKVGGNPARFPLTINVSPPPPLITNTPGISVIIFYNPIGLFCLDICYYLGFTVYGFRVNENLD